MTPSLATVARSFEVRFASLFLHGRALAFPCDERGCVDLDALSDRARVNYFFARAMVGRDYSLPYVCEPASVQSTFALACVV